MVNSALIRTLLIVLIFYLGANSPDFRSFAAKGLRISADWIEPKNSPNKNPRNFQIPNPFYVEEE